MVYPHDEIILSHKNQVNINIQQNMADLENIFLRDRIQTKKSDASI